MKADVDIELSELTQMLQLGWRALNGDSNDEEHDALYAIVETLERIRPSPPKRDTKTAEGLG